MTPPWHAAWPLDRWLGFATSAHLAVEGCGMVARRFSAWRHDRLMYQWGEAQTLALLATTNLASGLANATGRDEYRWREPVIGWPPHREPDRLTRREWREWGKVAGGLVATLTRLATEARGAGPGDYAHSYWLCSERAHEGVGVLEELMHEQHPRWGDVGPVFDPGADQLRAIEEMHRR